jgi:hypothetical protein
MTRRFLELLMAPMPGNLVLPVHEFVAFAACMSRRYVVPATRHSSTVAGWYDDIDALVADTKALSNVSGYIGVNPTTRDLLARSGNKVRVVRNRTKEEDITCLRWLYVDIDVKRPEDTSSTAGELAGTLELRDKILAENEAIAESAIWGMSGNGAWMLARLPDIANDSKGREGVGVVLDWLAERYGRKGRDRVWVDTTTRNASRVCCMPGTVKCKGNDRVERPWRLVTLDVNTLGGHEDVRE